ncbi:hypothetical protein Bca4012_068689 [Brassica carinata]
MSDVSGASSGSIVRPRRQIVGVPKQCWCRYEVAILMSKSDKNPYRRYHRCVFAAAKRLENDNHFFKWVDEALSEEIEALKNKTSRIKELVKEILMERTEGEKKVFEKMKMKLEKEIFERVEDVLVEAKWNMKKMCVGVVIGCMLEVAITKLV